uniref:Uncharacterized protein n=1 Tax=Timema bartmani TaxID=61472 RepID=A0A7R9F4K3_9NEOP|nr:unnamed protein product [Timema bartmani]
MSALQDNLSGRMVLRRHSRRVRSGLLKTEISGFESRPGLPRFYTLVLTCHKLSHPGSQTQTEPPRFSNRATPHIPPPVRGFQPRRVSRPHV